MLNQVLAIRSWLQADRALPYEQRLERDRALGITLAGDNLSRVLRWWQQIGTSANPVNAERPLALLILIAAVAGFAIGGSLGITAFAYDGHHPVNVFSILALTLVLPTLLLIPALFAAASHASAVPLFALNPGRLLAGYVDSRFGLLLFDTAAPPGSRQFAKWYVLSVSQWFAVCFFAGLLATAMARLVFSDVVFGWSSTVNLTPERVAALTGFLCLPWASWLPAAVPDLTLIEGSRTANAIITPAASSTIAAPAASWWLFLFTAIIVYGLLPRVLILAIALWRSRRAVRDLLLFDPEVSALLDRLARGHVDAIAAAPADPCIDASAQTPAATAGLVKGDAAAIVWNGALDEANARAFAAALGSHITAIVTLSSADGPPAQAQAFKIIGRSARTLIYTKGWEPPLLEFHDLLGVLRAAVPEGLLVIVPVNLDGDGVSVTDASVWSASIARTQLAGVYVQDGPLVVATDASVHAGSGANSMPDVS